MFSASRVLGLRLVSESCFLVLGLRQPSMQSDRTSHLQHQKPCRISSDFLGFRWKTIFASGNQFLYKPILTSDFIGKLVRPVYRFCFLPCAFIFGKQRRRPMPRNISNPKPGNRRVGVGRNFLFLVLVFLEKRPPTKSDVRIGFPT